MNNLDHETLIIGGGISGLSCAYFLEKKGRKFLLLEESSRIGGNIRTDSIQSCLIDAGPDSFVTTKPWALDLCKELGLEEELIAPRSTKVFLAKKKVLYPLPKGMVLGIPKLMMAFLTNRAIPLSLKLHSIKEFFFSASSKAPNGQDESVGHFIERHFGKKAVELFADPILGGIYAAKSHNLSLAATFPQLIQMEKKHGSLIRGFRQAAKQHASKGSKSIFYSLKRGMGSLIEALQKKIPQDSIHLNQKVMRIEKEEQGYKVYLESGKTLRTQNLILAIPPPTIASLFPKTSNLQKAISPFLCSSTATVFLAFPKKAIALKYDGLGFVCTRTLDHKILACTWASNKFSFRSPEDIFLMRCFLGGEGKEEVIDQSEEEMVKICQGELKNLMNIQADPLFSRVYKWSKRSPRYGVGQLERLKKLEESLRDYPNLHIIGNAYRGVGIPDCIRMAKECTEKLSSPTNS